MLLLRLQWWREGSGDGLNMKIWRNLGVIFITIFLHFHYFISLEIANTQESEVFLFRICLENVNASVVTCWYPQIYISVLEREMHLFVTNWNNHHIRFQKDSILPDEVPEHIHFLKNMVLREWFIYIWGTIRAGGRTIRSPEDLKRISWKWL